MTTITADVGRPTAATGFSRIWSVTKLHFVNPSTTITVPLIVMAGILFVNIAIMWIISISAPDADRADVAAGVSWSGASFYIFVYMMVVAVQSTNLTFPFAQGYGVTRRSFSLGAGLSYVILSVAFTALLTVLSLIEEATDGFGVGARIFTAVYFGDSGGAHFGDGWSQRAFIYLALFLFFFFVGSAVAAIYVRWRAIGITMFFVALAVGLVGAAFLITLTESWDGVAEFFVSAGWMGSFALLYVPTVVSAIGGYLLLQRATPRS